MSRDIIIIAQYTQAPGEHENDRFKYLTGLLTKRPDVRVEVVTMDFSHHRKEYRHVTDEQVNALGYAMTFIHVTPYKKNVSVSRLLSNLAMGKNLYKYLKNRKKPDAIYCAIPSLDAGYAAAKFAHENNIPFIVDVQDIWPEAFRMAIGIPVISDILFKPMEKKANYIYAQADAIVAVSQTYAQRALLVNKKNAPVSVVYLGTDLDAFDAFAYGGVKEDVEKTVIAYAGTLGTSYNLNSVIDAIKILRDKGLSSLKLLVMGDGPRREEFMAKAARSGIDALFTGRLPYGEMAAKLCRSDIAVNPIQAAATQSIINKHADYAAAGLPVVNTQLNSEYRQLLEKFQAGMNCADSPQEISDAIERLCTDPGLRKKMGENSRRMAEELFDRKKAYNDLCDFILQTIENDT